MESQYWYTLKTPWFISALIKAPGLILDFTKLSYISAQSCRQFNNSLKSYLPQKTRSHPFHLLRSRNSRMLTQSIHKSQMKSRVPRAAFQGDGGSRGAEPLVPTSQGSAARWVHTRCRLPQDGGRSGGVLLLPSAPLCLLKAATG